MKSDPRGASRSPSSQGLAAWARRRALPLSITVGLVALVLWQEPGLIIAETKLDLVVDPGGLLDRSRDLWDPSASFGQVPNQAVGYWFPMGPFFVLGDLLLLPAWLIQRVWMTLLLVTAFWGTLRVAEALDVGTPTSRALGALTYALSPTLLMLVAYRSGSQLPTALLPWALLPLITASAGGSTRRAAGRSALAVALMGGVNGSATFLVLAVPGLYLLTRAPGPRRRSLMLWWAGSVAAVSMWWIGPLFLQQRYGIDFLQLTEQARATTAKTSLIEVLRGAAYWESGLIVEGHPWLPAGIRFAVNELTVAGTAAVAAVGLSGLTLRGLRERTFLLLSLGLGIVLMGAGWGGPWGGPFDESVRALLDGPLAPIRNVHKLAPLIALPLAIGVAHAAAAVWRWWSSRPRPLSRLAAIGAPVVILGAASAPALLGELAPPGAYESIPDYWHDVTEFISEQGTGERTLLVPAATWAEYEWGRTLDEPLQPLAEDPWAVRNLVPFGGLGQVRLLDAIEDLFEDGRASAGLAPTLRRSGVEWLLVRNDLDRDRVTASSPVQVRRVLEESPGLERVAGFGPTVVDRLDATRLAPRLRPTPSLRALELYRVAGAVERVTASSLEDLLVVTGGPESTLTLSEHGVLDRQPMILAQDAGDAGPLVDAGDARWAMTDDLRRRNVFFGRVHDAASYALEPDEPAPDITADGTRAVTDRLLNAGPDDLAVIDPGDLRVRASSYLTGYARVPGSQPAAALDGSVGTSWRPAALRPLDEEWWAVDFGRPRSIRSVSIVQPSKPSGSSWIRTVRVTTDQGATTVRFDGPGARSTVTLPSGPTRHLRINIIEAELTFADFTTPGIAEVELSGVEPDRTLALSNVVPGAPAERAPDVIVMSRARTDPFDAFEASEEIDIDRRLVVTRPASYRLRGTAVIEPGPRLDVLLDDETASSASTASSVWHGLPAFRAERARDGDSSSAWLADPRDDHPELVLDLGAPTRVTGLELRFPPAPVTAPTVVEVVGAGGIRRGTAATLARFAPLVTDQVRIRLPVPEGRGEAVTRGIAEVEVLGPHGPVGGPRRENGPVDLPCGRGPEVEVDGDTVPTAVRGTIDDLRQGQRLQLRGCRPVDLSAGTHRITTSGGGGVQVDTLLLEGRGEGAATTARDVAIDRWGREQRAVRLGPGADSVLAVTENANEGWVAELDGEQLESVIVDGWRQGWIVPEGPGGVIRLRFTPGDRYDQLITLGLILAALALVAQLVPATRDGGRLDARRLPPILVALIGVVVVGAVAGVLALAVPVAIWVGRRRRLLPFVVVSCVTIAGGLAALRFWPPAVELVDDLRPVLVTQALLAVALATVFAQPSTEEDSP